MFGPPDDRTSTAEHRDPTPTPPPAGNYEEKGAAEWIQIAEGEPAAIYGAHKLIQGLRPPKEPPPPPLEPPHIELPPGVDRPD